MFCKHYFCLQPSGQLLKTNNRQNLLMMINATRKRQHTRHNHYLSYRIPKSILSANINQKGDLSKTGETTTFIISLGYHIDKLEVITASRFVEFCLNHILEANIFFLSFVIRLPTRMRYRFLFWESSNSLGMEIRLNECLSKNQMEGRICF